jgi:uncharacterized repeat protein (TIGR01451 family)
MKRSLYAIVLICCFCLTEKNSFSGNNFGIEWQKSFEFKSQNLSFSQIRQTNDGGYIIAGGEPTLFVTGPYLRVVKTDIFGEILLDTIYYNVSFGFLNDIEQTRDGGYILSGYAGLVSPHVYQFLKLSSNGAIEWEKNLVSTPWSTLYSIYPTTDGGYILGGTGKDGITIDKTEIGEGSFDFWIIKTDNLGNTIWQNTIGGNDIDEVRTIQQTSDGGYIIGGSSSSIISGDKTELNYGDKDYWIVKLDNTGNIEWQKTYGGNSYDALFTLEITNDNGFIISGNSSSRISGNKTTDSIGGLTWVIKTDSVGTIEWQKTYGDSTLLFRNIHQTSDSGYILTGNLLNGNIETDYDYEFLKTDVNGNIQWQYSIGGNKSDASFDMQQTSDGNYILAGNSYSDSSRDKTDSLHGCWLVKFNVTGIPFYLSGNIFSDDNNNCVQNVSENGLKNYTIKFTSNTDTIYRTTQNNGKYVVAIADTGLYHAELIPNLDYPYHEASNCNNYSIQLRDTINTANFAMTPTISCPLNTVNVSTNTWFRRCVKNTFYVSYCNNGSAISTNTFIDIKLDRLLRLDSTSITYTILPDNVYRFNIGNLDYFDCGTFYFWATPICDSTINGQTLCVEAYIYPDTICTIPSFDGCLITASAQCLGDSVQFQLRNNGSNMQTIKRYIVIEGNVMRMQNPFQLPQNGVLTLTLLANPGKTYRIIAERGVGIPSILGDAYTTAAVENCQPISNFPTGFFTQFPNYDGEPYRAVSCNVITGAYDPNDKVASPIGYATQHYIEANTAIDYQINFQNTGNDTAFKVVVVDTIAPTLDINSIQLGVASHRYQFQRTDSNVIAFVFDSIYLVDSFKNERLSHGFVKFKIQQKLNNANGSKIYNKADIYFDYNAPITTNQTYHTVGKDFVQVDLISTIKSTKYNVKEVKVFPNPFRDKTQIVVESDVLKNPILVLMTIDGKIIKSIPSSQPNTFDVYREDLSNGLYLFKILQDNETIANGKILVQ